MPTFSYTAIDNRGREETGIIAASSSCDAVTQLRAKGYFPTSVVESSPMTTAYPASAVSDEQAEAEFQKFLAMIGIVPDELQGKTLRTMSEDDLSCSFYTIDLHGIRYLDSSPVWRLENVLCWHRPSIRDDPRMRNQSATGAVGVFTLREVRAIHERFIREFSHEFEPGSLAAESRTVLDGRLSHDDTMFIVVHFYLDM